MPWWLTTIFPFLLLFFAIGVLLGVLVMWRRLQRVSDELDRRRLEGEAESDRLRLRIASLKDRDEQAARLENELEELRGNADRMATLQGQLQEAETRAHLVPALEAQLGETRDRAIEADRLEEELTVLRRRLVGMRDLESEVVDLRASAARSARLETEIASLTARTGSFDTIDAELRSARSELEESRSRTGQLDAELRAALADRDRLRARVMEVEADDGDCRARVAELEAELVAVRRELAAEVEAAPPELGPDGLPDQATWQDGMTSIGTPGARHVDDLKVISGIGPVMERTLNSFGIQTWEQIAAFTPADVEKVSAAIEAFPGRIERDDWIGGAKALLAQRYGPRGPVGR
ncbi:MAG: hypothetical protein AAGD35_18125 [Actinomycetota bacterium]